MVAKPKKISLTQAKKKAWTQYSRYIRLKYADSDGMVKCYTCSTVKHWKQMQAGHGIPSRSNSVLFMEEITRPQEYGCNVMAGGRYKVFTQNLINEIGLDNYDRCVDLSNQVVRYTTFELQELESYYKEKLLQLSN